MKNCLRFLLAAAALFPLVSCDKPAAPSATNVIQTDPALDKTQEELAAARDALQRQALEIETKTALMDKQLADMAQVLKERENVELRSSLDALKKQNDDLRSQADAARRQSNVIAQKIAPLPQVSVNVNVPAPRDYSLFYDQLGSYGRWFDVSGYGYCWRPTITTPRWRPYLDGCWMWSSFGWMWQSNEPFGWIVYHYGRWVNLSRYGWVWVPGCDWAPAWVAWRQSRDYVGWAPLPPDSGPCRGVYRDCDSHYNLGPSSYTFINTNVFMQPTYTSVCAPVTYNTSIFQSSVNVTQIVRCDDHKRPNTFVHHGGPPRAQIERACERPVQQVQVQTASADQIPRHRPGYHREPGASQPVIVDVPAARTGAQPIRPQIAEHIDKPKRVDAFEGVPQREAQEIRQTIAEEKATAVVQQQPVMVEAPSRFPHRSERPSAPVVTPVSSETVRPAVAVEDKPPAPAMPAIVTNEAPPAPKDRDSAEMVPSRRHRDSEATRPEHVPPMQRPSQPAAPAIVSTPEPEKPVPTVVVMPVQPATVIAAEPPPVVVETTLPQPSAAEKMAADAVAEAQRQQQEAQQHAAAEKMAAEQQTAIAEAEKARMQAAAEQTQREQAQAAAMQQKQQEEQAAQQRATAEKMAAEQAQAAAETERARQQAETAAMQRQQEEQATQQRAAAEKMAAEQAQAAEAVAMQRQQEEQAAQQRAAAERMAAEQAQVVAAEAERARQQAEVAAMQRQQEEATRRAQEMAQRQAEEQARRAAEEQMRREQEMAQRRAEEEVRRQAEAEMRRAQEMAQRQAEEQARRAAEEQMRRAQEMAQRQAEEAARRQAEEQMRRAQEEAQRAAQEAAQRAAQEAARNQPQPNPGS